MSDTLKKPTVGFFVTCLVDIMRPRVGFAAVKLLEQAGCEVEVPRSQSCCGQPAYNNGDEANSLAIAKQIIKVFDQDRSTGIVFKGAEVIKTVRELRGEAGENISLARAVS